MIKPTKPADYQEAIIPLPSGSSVTAYYKVNCFVAGMTAIRFYGETISETGFRSWIGYLTEFADIVEGVTAVAYYLEAKTLEASPNLLVTGKQLALF